MAQPFVISMRIDGDSTSAVTATKAETTAVQELGAAADAARVQVVALNGGSSQSATAAQTASQGHNQIARALDDLRAKFNPLHAATRQYQANTAEIEKAHKLGAISANEMTAALARERAAYDQLNAAASKTPGGLKAANSTATSGSFNTANVAAQFQDIAVTSAMGMNPLQIALQQGTQISAAFGNQGAAGAVKLLGSAFLSVISPVSLLTIAAVALGSTAIQSFMGMIGSAKSATQSLEEHKHWLDLNLVGYESVKTAAGKAADEAQRLPRGALSSNLGAGYAQAQEAFIAKLKETEAAQARVNERVEELKFFQQSLQGGEELYGPIVKATEDINKFGLSAGSSTAQIADFITNVTTLNNSVKDEGIKTKTTELVALGSEVLEAKAKVESFSAALANLANTAPITIAINARTDAAFDAIQQLKNQAPDNRSSREKARDTYNTAIGAAPDGIIRQAAEVEYKKTLAALDVQDEQKAADRASRASVREAKKVSEYDQAIKAIRERIGAQEVEANVIGLSAYASEKARQQFELENAARKDGIGLTAARVAQIDREASAYAQVTAALSRQQGAYDAMARAGESSIDTVVDAFASGEKSIGDILNSIIGDWRNMIIELTIKNPLKNAFLGQNNPTGSDVGGWFGSIFSTLFGGGRVAAGASALKLGAQSAIPHYAVGTNSHPGGLARINEEGGEIVDLPNGTRVYPTDLSRMMAQAGNSSGASSNLAVNVYTPAGMKTETQESTDSNGGRRVDVMIEEATAKAINRPGSPARSAIGSVGQLVRR